MDHPDRNIRKIHKLCFKKLRKGCSEKVASRLLREFAEKLPTTKQELSSIVTTFRRARTDVQIILTICKHAKLKKNMLKCEGG